MIPSPGRMFGYALATALAGLVPACAVDQGDDRPLQQPDRALFALESAPILEKRCGDVFCHGNSERAFALYARGRRRLDPAETYSKQPLNEAEIDANYRMALGFIDAPQPRDTTLLRKAVGWGGKGGHKGGAIFEAPSDPEVRALERWIREVWE